MTQTNIFLTGATGYIGGSVLTRLLDHPNVEHYNVTVLVRSEAKGSLLEKFGMNVVLGDLNDLKLVQSLSEKAHVVLSCADADNLSAMEAMLRGLKERYRITGVVPILIHTSGAGVVSEPADGMHVSDKVWSDMDVPSLKEIPPEAPHRNVDLAVMHADEEGYVITHIIAPSLVFGKPLGPLVEAGVVNSSSVAIPLIANVSVSRKNGGFIGAGKPIWPVISITDTADLYIYVLDKSLTDMGKVRHGWEGFYLLENGECSWYEIGKGISKVLVELGVGNSEEPTSFTEDEIFKLSRGSPMIRSLFGSNCRCRADRARSIGWKATHTTADMLSSIKPEIQLILARSGQ